MKLASRKFSFIKAVRSLAVLIPVWLSDICATSRCFEPVLNAERMQFMVFFKIPRGKNRELVKKNPVNSVRFTRKRCWLRHCIQAGWSRFRFPMGSLRFFIDFILPCRNVFLRQTQPLREMNNRSLPCGVKAGSLILTTFSPSCADCLNILRTSTSFRPLSLSRPVQGQLHRVLCWSP